MRDFTLTIFSLENTQISSPKNPPLYNVGMLNQSFINTEQGEFRKLPVYTAAMSNLTCITLRVYSTLREAYMDMLHLNLSLKGDN